LDGVILLKPQQVVAGDPQQQPVTCFEAAIRQRWQHALGAALQFEHIHIKTALQAAVAEGLAHQAGAGWDRHFCGVAALARRRDQFG